MPMKVVEKECTDSDGKNGSFVLQNKETGESEGCYQSRQKAKRAMKVRKMQKNKEREG